VNNSTATRLIRGQFEANLLLASLSQLVRIYPAHCQDNSDIQWVLPGINTVVTKISPATQKEAYYDLSVARCHETEKFTILSRMCSGEIRFDVLLTVHLSIILVINQLNARILLL
jgi:hypothetical protein